MKEKLRALSILAELCSLISYASFVDANESLPIPLVEAAEAYKSEGANAFLPTLVKGSRLLNTNDASFVQATHMLNEIESLYGSYLGLELVSSIPIAPSTRVVYFILNYERGPLYGVLSAYKTTHGEIVTSSNVNTELLQIIPADVVADIR